MAAEPKSTVAALHTGLRPAFGQDSHTPSAQAQRPARPAASVKSHSNCETIATESHRLR